MVVVDRVEHLVLHVPAKGGEGHPRVDPAREGQGRRAVRAGVRAPACSRTARAASHPHHGTVTPAMLPGTARSNEEWCPPRRGRTDKFQGSVAYGESLRRRGRGGRSRGGHVVRRRPANALCACLCTTRAHLSPNGGARGKQLPISTLSMSAPYHTWWGGERGEGWWACRGWLGARCPATPHSHLHLILALLHNPPKLGLQLLLAQLLRMMHRMAGGRQGASSLASAGAAGGRRKHPLSPAPAPARAQTSAP